MGEMSIMDEKAGDLKVIWNPKIKEEIEAAKDQFEKLIKKGYKAFAVKKGGEKGKELKEFDEDEEMMILAPAPVKGCIQRLLGPYNP